MYKDIFQIIENLQIDEIDDLKPNAVLKLAIKVGDIDAVKFIIEDKTIIEPFEDGTTPLHTACEYHQINILEYLLAKSLFDIEAIGEFTGSALHIIRTKINTLNNIENLIDLLLDNGLSIDIKDKNGATALSKACDIYDLKTIKWLVNNKANLNAKDYDGLTPLMYLVRNSIYEDNGALDYLIDCGALVNEKDNDGNSVLIHSINGITDFVEILLKRGANINASNNSGITALMYALSYVRYDEKKIVNLLIDNGADIFGNDNQNNSTLMYASENVFTDHLDYLINEGVQVNYQNKLGQTPLMFAVSRKHETDSEIDSFLLNAGANVNILDNDGRSALFYASKCGNTTAGKKLLKAGAEAKIVFEKAKMDNDYMTLSSIKSICGWKSIWYT
jgi:ankyrin repeat protein